MPHVFLADYALFFGRFHPLIVHLPIGFLLLAVVLEVWPGDRVRPAIKVAWVVGALSAVAAAVAGWLLASGGGYGGQTLFWHRWAGVTVAALAVGGVFLQSRGGMTTKVYGLMTAAALMLAGHQGGNLTHGEEYLFQYAPAVVQQLSGHTPDSLVVTDWSVRNTDSIAVYAEFLRPVIDDKCVRCHNSEEQNGGLRMDSTHYLLEGGESGPLFVAGNAIASRWHNRVTLPTQNVKAMPPQGERMTFAEVRLLEYWLNEGADTSYVFQLDEVPEDIKALLQRDYALDLRPRMFVETVRAPVLEDKTREGLRSLNWSVTELVPGGPALEVKPQPGKSINADGLRELAAAAPAQLTYLGLDNQALTPEELQQVSAFKNLNRLRLNGTAVDSTVLRTLTQLKHLESLNLYNTRVGDEVFDYLQQMPALRRVYLWQTEVSPEAATAYVEAHPEVMVDTGAELLPAPQDAKK